MNRLTKIELRDRLGFTQDAELADFFGISASAVSQWGDEVPVPKLRQFEAERRRPSAFDDQFQEKHGDDRARPSIDRPASKRDELEGDVHGEAPCQPARARA